MVFLWLVITVSGRSPEIPSSPMASALELLHLQLAIAALIRGCQQFINGGIVPLGALKGLQHLGQKLAPKTEEK